MSLSSIPGDALLGKARREIRGDGGAPLLGSNDLRDKSGDAVLFWRDMFGTGCNPFNDPGALGTRDSGTKLRPTGLPLLATGCGIPDGTVVCDGSCRSPTPLEYGSDDEAAVYDRVMMPPTLPPCSSCGERIIVSSSSAESSR